MRDIHRIKPIMEELTAIWEENPDWRFGQLVSNVLGEVMKKYNISDMFFPEDDFWLNGIREYRKNHSLYNYGQNLLDNKTN